MPRSQAFLFQAAFKVLEVTSAEEFEIRHYDSMYAVWFQNSSDFAKEGRHLIAIYVLKDMRVIDHVDRSVLRRNASAEVVDYNSRVEIPKALQPLAWQY